MDYSVLMSVYYKEEPENLKMSMESIYTQTIPTDDFVLVCDGELTLELNEVIADMQQQFGNVLHVVRLSENMGLGNALNIGLKQCRHELVARMDSDDISFSDRCEKQLRVFQENLEISILSGTILEFSENPEIITGKRILPETHEEICIFSHKRNPFNHPAVMLKKSAVDLAGGYKETYPLFEDYYLWVRMLQCGCKGYNLQEPLLYMRTPMDIYKRRGGKKYAENLLRFHKWLIVSGWIKKGEFIVGALPHAVICVLPNGWRKKIYQAIR